MHNPILPLLFSKSAIESDSRARLEITVQSFHRPRALGIALEILAYGNSYFQMGHGHLASLLSSQSVSRGY
jgi:hypothetical protein